MKKRLLTVAVSAAIMISSSASAGWFGNNSDWGGYDDNDWPEWTPMYWMEEMMDEWDNDDDEDFYRYGGQGYGPRYGYDPRYGSGGYGPMPYPQMPAMPYAPMQQMQQYAPMAPRSNYLAPEAPRAPAPAIPTE